MWYTAHFPYSFYSIFGLRLSISHRISPCLALHLLLRAHLLLSSLLISTAPCGRLVSSDRFCLSFSFDLSVDRSNLDSSFSCVSARIQLGGSLSSFGAEQKREAEDLEMKRGRGRVRASSKRTKSAELYLTLLFF